jgi:hypothetical protein
VLSLLRRKPKPLAQIEHQAQEPHEAPRRKKQQNIKVTEDTSIAFAAVAEAQGLSKAALFEDMVAERIETLQRQGIKLGIS